MIKPHGLFGFAFIAACLVTAMPLSSSAQTQPGAGPGPLRNPTTAEFLHKLEQVTKLRGDDPNVARDLGDGLVAKLAAGGENAPFESIRYETLVVRKLTPGRPLPFCTGVTFQAFSRAHLLGQLENVPGDRPAEWNASAEEIISRMTTQWIPGLNAEQFRVFSKLWYADTLSSNGQWKSSDAVVLPRGDTLNEETYSKWSRYGSAGALYQFKLGELIGGGTEPTNLALVAWTDTHPIKELKKGDFVQMELRVWGVPRAHSAIVEDVKDLKDGAKLVGYRLYYWSNHPTNLPEGTAPNGEIPGPDQDSGPAGLGLRYVDFMNPAYATNDSRTLTALFAARYNAID